MQKIGLSKAIEALQNGDIVVYPTDTLYAFGVDIHNKDAVGKVFEVKKRPLDNPLPVAVSDLAYIEKIAFVSGIARDLAEQFLPGPLTMILNKKNVILDVITGGLDNVAVRIPDNDVALELLSRYGPLTVTSANVHGKEVPDIISDIKMQFNSDDVAVYLDYGKLNGLPSTIVDMTASKPRIVRDGAITKEEILDVIEHG
jgi:L-threonylcarbamoyladenylate synthase